MSRLVEGRPSFGREAIAKPDNYLDRVAKYVPSEVVAAYVFCQGIILSATSPEERRIAFIVVVVGLAVLTPLYIRKLAVPGLPWRTQAVISTISFFVWVYALGEAPKSFGLDNPLFGSIILVLYTAGIGLVQPEK